MTRFIGTGSGLERIRIWHQFDFVQYCFFAFHLLRKNAFRPLQTGFCSFHISLSNTCWRLLLFFLLISSWNFHDVCQRILYTQKRNFSWIRQKVRNFPIDPRYKNRPLLLRHVYRHDVTKVGDFYNGDLWGKYLSFVGSSWNFVPGYIKNVDTHQESFS